MEILDSFGFEPAFFVAQIINFLILAFVFKKFLYKPMLKLLKDREKTISQGLTDAERAAEALENANAQKDEILKKATLEAEKIISETKKSAESIRVEILAKSKSDADRLIEEAKTAAEEELQKTKDVAKNNSIELSRKVLDKVLAEFFTKEEKEKILNRNIKLLDRYE